MNATTMMTIYHIVCYSSNDPICKRFLPPENLRITEKYSSSLIIDWWLWQGQTYNVIATPHETPIVDCNNEAFENVLSPFTLTHTIDGMPLRPGRRYNIGVCAVDASRPSRKSNISLLQNVELGPSPPYNVSSASIHANELIIRWKSDEMLSSNLTYYVGVSRTNVTKRLVVEDSHERSRTIQFLTPSTAYNVSVQTVIRSPNRKQRIRSDLVAGMVGVTIPSTPQLIQNCQVVDNTSQICVNWLKPKGGDEIENYVLRWTSRSRSFVDSSLNIPHERGENSFQTTIDKFLPGDKIKLNVSAQNSAGFGLPAMSTYYTNPTFPRDIIFTKTEDELVIQWTPPRGFANYIAIESPEGIFEPIVISNDDVSNHTIFNITFNATNFISIYSILQTSFGELESERIVTPIVNQIESTHESTGIIIGLAVGSFIGCIFLIIAFAVVIYLCHKKRLTKKNHTFSSHPTIMVSPIEVPRHEYANPRNGREPSLPNLSTDRDFNDSRSSIQEVREELSHVYETVSNSELLPEVAGYIEPNTVRIGSCLHNFSNKRSELVRSAYENEIDKPHGASDIVYTDMSSNSTPQTRRKTEAERKEDDGVYLTPIKFNIEAPASCNAYINE